MRRIILSLCLLSAVVPVIGATQADVHVAVYSSGFLVDSRRQVTYGDGVSHVLIKTTAKGTAKGETQDSAIEIDRVDKGVQWQLDPRAKTYSEEPFETSSVEKRSSASASSTEPVTLHVSEIDPTVSGPLGSDMINGLPCQSYTIRLVADFSDPQSGKVVATETLLEKLWVTQKAPEIEKFRKEEGNFQDAVTAIYGTEKASFRWLLREFNKHILEINGNPDDFRALQSTYQGARNSIKGVTVRELAGWNWRTKDDSAPGAGSGEDMNAFIASIAAGLGALPDEEGKTPLSDSEKPKWVKELEKDVGRTGSTAMYLEEVRRARDAQVAPHFFEVPTDYRKL